jgi:hypothetical protein
MRRTASIACWTLCAILLAVVVYVQWSRSAECEKRGLTLVRGLWSGWVCAKVEKG